ncbi:PepSY domain-containing protein [Dyadobacter sp. 3J3]|uniref:PepSY-associated TM helix domain-containing protein n=1 Tax=Dyadobacter sp. 3J3 TaxID=2606600 RepID=UPI00190F0A97|nr:PepSY-associated TM helix domain-containing protein [Dyadobacter sp. 3J3]
MKKVLHFLHLWLGIGSGIIVFILAVTGCIYGFQQEIQDATQSFRFVEPQHKPFLAPSTFRVIAEKELPNKKIHSVQYGDSKTAAVITFFNFDPEYYYLMYANPYTGEILETRNMDSDFFRFILMGHYYLWLPPTIGQPIAASATLIFVFMLLSGLVLWWPKNKAALKQRFKVKWNAQWRRKNYDLHNVLGFYSIPIALIIACTGLIMGFQWFSKSVYWATSGGQTMTPFYEAESVGKPDPNKKIPAIDFLWKKTMAEYPAAQTIEMHYPETAKSTIAAVTNPVAGTFYKADYIYYDQYSLKEIPVTHNFGRYHDELTLANKIMRMNYDIHIGAIIGLPGKILAFIISAITASLPVTGFIIWWGRRKKSKKPKVKMGVKKEMVKS